MKYNDNDPCGMTRLQDSFLSLFDSLGANTEASVMAYQYVAGAWNLISTSDEPDRLDLSFKSFDKILDILGDYVLDREQILLMTGSDEDMSYTIEEVIDSIKGYVLLTVFCQLDEYRREPEFFMNTDRICIKYFSDSGSTSVFDPLEAIYEVMESMEIIRFGYMLKCDFVMEPLLAGIPYYDC